MISVAAGSRRLTPRVNMHCDGAYIYISVCNSHTAGGIYAEGGTYVRWFPAEGEIISVPRMMGMNKKCARNNGVDLWILEEDGITYI